MCSWIMDETAEIEELKRRLDASETALAKHAAVEEALRASEEKYKAIFEAIDEGFCLVEVLLDEHGIPADILHLDANPAYERHTGLKDIVGKRALEIAPEAGPWLDFYGQVALTGQPARIEPYFLIGRWITAYATRVGGENSRKVAIVFNDVTERTLAEQALRESETRHRLLVETWAQAMWETDAAGMVGADSPSWRSYTGQTLEGWLGYGWLDAIHPDDRAYAERQWREAIEARSRVNAEFRFRAPNGGWRWTNVLAAPVLDARGEIEKWAGLNIDIDVRVRAETALRESEERMRRFGEASQDVLWIRNAETLQWEYLTPAFETIYGLGRNLALGGDNMANWTELILPEDREYAVGSIQRVRDGEQVTFEYRIRRPLDGQVRWLRNTDFPIQDETGQITRIGGVGHDVTALKEAEAALAAAAQHQRFLLENIPQLVWRAVDEGNWTWASPQWTTFTGQAEEDSHGRGWLDPIHPEDRQAALDAWAQARKTGGFEVEYRIGPAGAEATQEGYRWFQMRATSVHDDQGSIVEWFGTSTDIHELRQLQERQKVLVAELQHRTRNLLGVIRATADKTARTSANLAEFREAFGDRLNALARVQGLLSRMEEHDRITFDELISSEMAALDGAAERVTLDGPAGIRLRSSMVQTLAMALHELATNAVKYGALGQEQAHLAISWVLNRDEGDGRPRLHIDWRESGVAMPPAGARPGGSGQGRLLIERALPHQLGAKTTYVLGADGVHCTIEIPVSLAPVKQNGEHD